MATWRETIEDALLEIGVLAQGEPAEDGQLTHAGRLLEQMLATWGGYGLIVPGNLRTVHAVTRSARFWTMGPATVSGSDPPDIQAGPYEQIDSIYYTYQGNTDGYLLREVSLVALKAEQSTVGFRPTLFWFGRTDAPYQNIRFDRRTLSGDTLVIEGRGVFERLPSDLTMETGLPPIYEGAIRSNLAVRLAPSNGATVPPALARGAMMDIKTLMKRNIGDPEAVLERALRHRDNGRYGDGYGYGRY